MSSSSSNKQFAHLQIPLEEIVSATNNFSDANLIRQDKFGKEYIGKFLRSGQLINIVARRLDDTHGLGNNEFWMEVSMLARLKHDNIVSIVGFCDEKGEKIVVNKHEANGSLRQHLSLSALTWMRRLRICVGVARALSYIYYDVGPNFSVIHRDIKSFKIKLGDRWEAKLCGFEFSMNQAETESQLPHPVCGTDGYSDPAYIQSGSVTHKSDMFSLGVVLFEVLCGKSALEDNVYLFQRAKSNYEGGRLYEMVNPILQVQMDSQSFKIFSEIAYKCLNEQPLQRPNIDQIVIELDKALESQRKHEDCLISKAYLTSERLKFAHLRIPLEEIVSATNNFSDANLIRVDEFCKEYKGQLLQCGQLIEFVARRLHSGYRKRNKEFWMEVSILSTLKHENLVSIIGFCDENGEKIIINKHEARGSLNEYLRDPTLTWIQRLHICVGVAHALRYIYYDKGRDFSFIHRDIKSSKVLLNDHWQAKLSGFELSVNQTETGRNRLCITEFRGTQGYCDPTYVTSGTVSHKSDIYSLGVVLFEVLCGKKAIMVDEDNRYLAPLTKSHYEGGKLDDMVDLGLRKQMDEESFKIFSETAYCCLKEQRSQRPDINQIVRKLEQALKSQQNHENPLVSKAYSMVEGITSKSLKGKNIEHLEIPLSDILSATDNFAERYLIGSGGYGKVYKAELYHFDSKNFLPLEENNKGDLPKKRSSVAIKRILKREDNRGEEGFLAEIEMLTSCKHPNIISLVGFCKEGGYMILVYEHASNGSLETYLGRNINLINLTWVQRIKICIDIACGLNYLHTKIEDDRRIIHRDIKCGNILLGENWVAKIADFGLSKFQPENQQMNKTIHTDTVAGTELYWDPEYVEMGNLKNESDIYSFGVVLFEMLSGRFANDPIYTKENSNGIAAVARRHFNEGTIKKMVDPRLMEEYHENIFTINKGPDEDSLNAFSEIAYQCVEETQAKRPTAEVIIRKLAEALSFQENIKDHLKFSLEDIKTATQDFAHCIGQGGFGSVYKGEVTHANRRNSIAAKRWSVHGNTGQGEHEFLMELQILLEYKHDNIIGLVGYCNEMAEKIIVYEYASRGSLYEHLKNDDLTWMKRLQICIDIASGLDFLHGGGADQEVVIHRDIQSGNVLLNDDWKAKITDFGFSLISPINNDMDFVIDNACGTPGYIDPLFVKLGFISKESDIYSLGVVLFEILCGRSAYIDFSEGRPLPEMVKHSFVEGKLDEMVFEGIKEQIMPKSLTTFQTIALQCLHDERKNRPTTSKVLMQLMEALEFQEDYEIWEPKLPNDYEEIFKMSNLCEDYFTQKKKNLYEMLSRGILLQKGQVLFSLGDNGERNEMISAIRFLYKHRRSYKWPTVPESRFHKVAEMVDIANLKIKIKIKAQLLSLGVNYGVHLVFRFCEPRNSVAKRMYVNLKYKKGSETLHAYFATSREDGWMMIELCRFLNHKKDTSIEFLLEGFSRSYCGSRAIYVDGIEFRAIDNVKHEVIKKSKEVQQVSNSDSNMDQQLPSDCEKEAERFESYDEGEKILLLNQVNKKKRYMLSAKEALFEFSDVKLINPKPSSESRFEDVVELGQQVFGIKCKIESQRLSPDTEYLCYLVFKLSDECCGLHCPVIVRDLLHRKNKEKRILYFRSPNPCNVDDADRVPEEREDGWMEVIVWQFNSKNELGRDDRISINLKLISYEGTMSGLIVSGLEFRPM